MAYITIFIVFYCFFREEKLKLKKARNLHTKQATLAVEDLSSENDAEKSDVDLSWLPDPDRVFPPKDENAEDSDRSELSLTRRGSDDDDGEDGADSYREEEAQRKM